MGFSFNVVDLFLLVVFITVVFIAYKRGLTKILAGFLSMAGALVITKLYSSKLVTFVYSNFNVNKVLENYVTRSIERISAKSSETASEKLSFLNEGLQNQTSEILNAIRPIMESGNMFIPPIDNSFIQEMPKTTFASIHDNGVRMLAESMLVALTPIVYTIIQIACFGVLFIASVFVLRIILSFLAKTLHNLPIVGGVDKLAGAGVGVVMGVIIVAVIVTILPTLLFITGDIGFITQSYLQTSVLYGIIW